jgi:hypothetical protein
MWYDLRPKNKGASEDRNSRALIRYAEHNIALPDGSTPVYEISGRIALRMKKLPTK